MPESVESPVISLEEFRKIRLVVGKVIEVKDHPGADKLYILKVDMGGGKIKQLVAGLRGRVPINEIQDRLVVVVDNLKPAVLRGERSEGMMLVATDGEKLVVLTTHNEVQPGSGIS